MGEKETARKTEESRLSLKQREKLREKMRKTPRDRDPAQRTERERERQRKRLEGAEGERDGQKSEGTLQVGGRAGVPRTRRPGRHGWRRLRMEKLILLVIYSPAFGPLCLPLPPARAACSNIRYKQVNCVMDHIKQALRLEAGFNLHGRLACLPSKAPRGTPSCNRIPPLRAH